LKSAQFIDREFTEAQRVITDETGISPTIMRPPYGFRWLGLRQVQRKHALLGVMWTVMGNDIHWPSERIADHVLQRVAPGGIICLHDACGVRAKPDVSNTLRALRKIVPVLKDNEFRFEVISDLMQE
jgi:chitin deacetylase